MRYQVYRKDAESTAFERLGDEPVRVPEYLDAGLPAAVEYTYVVRTVDRREQESRPTSPTTAAALPEIREPVFVAAFSGDADARLLRGENARAKLHGAARLADGVLDLRQGGHVTFQHRPEFDLRSGFSVECRLHVDKAGEMPVLVSCGSWRGTGWFLQRLGNHWRWHVGGVDCDGGRPVVGRWVHLLASFDGKTARLFADGVEVASRPCRPNRKPWPGPLFVGQYGAGPGPSYQVNGRISGVRVYARAVSAEEAAAMCRTGTQ